MKKKLDSNKYILDKISVGYIESKLYEINKKAERLKKRGRIPEDFPKIELTYKEIDEDLANALMHTMDKLEKKNFEGKHRSHILVSLNSDKVPKLDDWAVLGMLEKIENSSKFTMTSFAESNKIPVQYRDADPCNCDHCGHNRKRNSTFIIKHEETKEIMQVGKSCMKDFVSSSSLEMLMLHSSLNQILDCFDPDDYSRGGVNSIMFSKQDFLASVNACMKVTGEYVSYAKSDIVHERPNTKLMATHCLDSNALLNFYEQHKNFRDGTYPQFIKNYKKLIESIKVDDSDYDHVEEVIDYFTNKPPQKGDNDFYFNIYNLITSEAVFLDEKKLGLVAYAIEHYNKKKKEELLRSVAKDKESKAFDIQPYIAENREKDKEKIESVEVFISRTPKIKDSEYGDSLNYYLKTRDGRDIHVSATIGSYVNGYYNETKNAGILDCFLDKGLNNINSLLAKINEFSQEGKKMWLVIKGTCTSHYSYIDKNENEVNVTRMNRVCSIGDFTTEPSTDGVIYRNDKYKISQFKVDKILEAVSSQTGEKHFKYELKDKDDNSFILYSFKKIDGLKEGQVFTVPHQRYEDEVMGHMSKNIRLDEGFIPEFEDSLITKAKAIKFNQAKTPKQKQG